MIAEPLTPRIDFEGLAPGFNRALASLDRATTAELDRAGIDRGLRELVRLRASQLNGCAYCVDMHSQDAEKAGYDLRTIAAVPVWRESPFFTDHERAALALTEAVTRASETHVPSATWNAAAEHFTDTELAALVSLIVTINAWNLVGVTTRTWSIDR
ncbi:MAG: carboxymuconolactone decarboxylase family protein [Thermomicrobiales bacterium]